MGTNRNQELFLERIEYLFHVLEILKKENINLKNIPLSKTVNGERYHMRLKDLGIDDIIKKYNLDGEYYISRKIEKLRLAYKGNGYKLTEEQKKKIEELDMINKEFSRDEFFRILEILVAEGVDVRKIPIAQTKEDGTRKVNLEDIKQDGIDIHKIIKKYDLNPQYSIGNQITAVRYKYKYDKANMSIEDQKRTLEYGITTKRTSMEELTDILEILQKEGIDVRKIPVTKISDNKREHCYLKDLNAFGMNIDEIIKKYSLNPDYPIGNKIHALISAYNEYGTSAIGDKEKRKLEEMGFVEDRKRKKADLEEVIKILEYLKEEKLDIRKIPIGQKVEGELMAVYLKDVNINGIDINSIIEKYKLNPQYPIGRRIALLRSEYKEGNTLKAEERKRVEELGIVEVKRAIEEVLEVLEILQNEGVEINKIPITKTKKGEKQVVTLDSINQEGIDIDAIIEKYKLDKKYPIGIKITNLRQAYRGVRCSITDEEKRKAEALGIISIKDLEAEQKQLLIKLEQAKELKERANELKNDKNMSR